MKNFLKLSLVSAAAIALTGCSSLDSTGQSPGVAASVAKKEELYKAAPRITAGAPKVSESEQIHIPVIARKVSEYSWLRAKKVTINASHDPVPMSEILRSLSKQGLSITSELPLDRFNYSGFSLSDVDAESALRAIVSSVGLDYRVDTERKLVAITPLSSKTWYLNLGNRRSNFTSGGTTNTGLSKGGIGADSGLTSGGGSGGGSGANNVTAVNSTEDFWTSLKTELTSRLQLMLPAPIAKAAAAPQPPPALSLPPLAAPAGGLSIPPLKATPPVKEETATSEGLLNLVSKQVGTFSMNPETGAIQVQAPHWVLDDLAIYFKRVQEMYNTDIMFQGELILLTSTNKSTEGLDIGSFARFANTNYGLTYRNNGLGGVTLSSDAFGIPAVSSINPSIGGPILGLVSAIDGLAVFNAYLTNIGTVSTLQRPMLTTTSGVPADFRRIETRYFNSVSQQSSSSNTGSAAVATQNTLIAQDFGTVLRVNPRMDISTGLIRAQIELVQTTQTGIQAIPQSVSNGNSVSQVNSQLPIVSKVIYSGEALLKNGDLIVMGGQVEDSDQLGREGMTGLMDIDGLSGVFGKNTKEKSHKVFYFAMKVSVTKR